ncbi:RNA-binding protein 42-like isoform X2 [Lineus longissimus]|uniref:RNA-binding protein 42-like isoform X2 n=1 Tax=Lineus longissimus TaxID=88925 RepID=UPI00315D8DF0
MISFEEEISTVQEAQRIAGQARFILGAQTFQHVQQQLQHPPPGTEAGPAGSGMMLQAPPPPPPSSTASYEQQTNYALAPPPPPPPDNGSNLQQYHHPPPPPPSFLPPQLRHRHPRPPPPMMAPRPPMGMPPRGPPPMGPPGMGMRPPPLGPPPGMPPRMMPRPFPHHMPHYHQQREIKNDAVIIAKPKIVYTAPPVKKAKKRKAKKEKTDEPTVEKPAAAEDTVVEYEPSPMASMMEEDTGMSGMDMEELSGDMDDEAGTSKKGKGKKKKVVRTAAGTTWEDDSLLEWESDDFRIFCGDLGNEVTDEILTRAFSKYGSFLKAKVCREKRTNKTKGYGFVSFKDPTDFVRAMREMNGKYVGNRPIKLRKSSWRDRNIDMVKKKEREKKRLGLR